MWTYLLKRLGFVVFVVWGVTLATFFIAQVVPGDPALSALGDNAREEQIQAWRQLHGLNEPVIVQYGIYLKNLLGFDLVPVYEPGAASWMTCAISFPAHSSWRSPR